jgi:DNA mismatch endonuclease (patch repair protein)
MQATPRRDTAAEISIRSALHRRGLRFRVDRRVLPSCRTRVDVVFVSERVAVFVDGCFWHGCPRHGSLPLRTNAHFWAEKIATNKRRDLTIARVLRRAGWRVLRVWEHEDPASAADRIERLIRRIREGTSRARA